MMADFPAPQVSVLLPARNAERTLERAVRSILTQTFRAFELVAVDDGSTDGTSSLLARLAREDSRVRVLRAEGKGISAALNLGLAECRAPLLARMDADDESLPQRLERSVAALEADPSLCGLGTGVELFRDDRPVSPNLQLYAKWLNGLGTKDRLFRERFIESPLCHPSVTLRTAAVREVGGWTSEPVPEDYALWLTLLDAGHALRCLPEVLFRWRDHDDRLTRTDPRYSEEAFRILKARHLVRGPLRAGRCRIWGAGQKGLRLARALRAEGVGVERFYEVSPHKIGQRIDGIPVSSWEELRGPGTPHLVAAVGAKGAREEIRAALVARGWTEGDDFTSVA
jgi:hypothetical protein